MTSKVFQKSVNYFHEVFPRLFVDHRPRVSIDRLILFTWNTATPLLDYSIYDSTPHFKAASITSLIVSLARQHDLPDHDYFTLTVFRQNFTVYTGKRESCGLLAISPHASSLDKLFLKCFYA